MYLANIFSDTPSLSNSLEGFINGLKTIFLNSFPRLSAINPPRDEPITLEIPNNYFGGIFPRSGTAVKRGLRLANCVGVIDADYRGEVKVPLYNDSSVPQKIELNERIAQLIILPFATVEYEVVDELSDTERGEGGFNSTGRK